jgi:hypothetical protein
VAGAWVGHRAKRGAYGAGESARPQRARRGGVYFLDIAQTRLEE